MVLKQKLTSDMWHEMKMVWEEKLCLAKQMDAGEVEDSVQDVDQKSHTDLPVWFDKRHFHVFNSLISLHVIRFLDAQVNNINKCSTY